MEPGTIIAAVEVCFQAGVLLVKTVQHFRHAEVEVKERVVKVEDSWARIRLQLQFIQSIAHTLDDDLARVQDEILALLATKLSLAHKGLDNVVKKADAKGGYFNFVRVRRGKYVLAREGLDKAIDDLEGWQRRFDPSWFLIMCIANPVIDQQLAAHSAAQGVVAAASPCPQSLDGSGGFPDRPRSSARSLSPAPPPTGRTDRRQHPLALATVLRRALRTEQQHRDQQHCRSVFLPQPEGPTERVDIPFSSATATRIGGHWFIIDSYACQPQQGLPGGNRGLAQQTQDVRTLASKLASVDPWTFGLLNCKGVIKVVDRSEGMSSARVRSFDFVFRMPEGLDGCQSLRQNLLTSGDMHYSLSRRVTIAKDLARSVSYVHNFNFVHKNVCPESVLLLEDATSSRYATFLVGFDNFRSVDGGSNYCGDGSWERNVYRHPSRQGVYPEDKYRMQHDVYSLGVCLLEIGLWQSFVAYSSDSPPVPRYGQAHEDFTRWLQHEKQVAGAANGGVTVYKDYFVNLAHTRLPLVMGDRYASVVTSCLTCLDSDSEDFGDFEADQMREGEDIQVAVRFIEKVLLKLNEICV